MKSKSRHSEGGDMSLLCRQYSICRAYEDSAVQVHGQASASDKPTDQDSGQIFKLKELARELKASDIEKKIDLEARMRDAAKNILKHLPDSQSEAALQAGKNLVVSERRMKVYEEELEGRRFNSVSNCCLQPSTAKISLNDLRIPLIWNQRDHFKNRGDSRQFAMFCVVQAGSELFDSKLWYGVDRSWTDLTIQNLCAFENLNCDFVITIELYSALVEADHSDLLSTQGSIRLKRKVRGSLSRSFGQKFGNLIRKQLDEAAVETPAGQPNCKQYECVARTILDIEDIRHNHSSSGSFDLDTTSWYTTSKCPPLYGHLCCDVRIEPDSASSPLCTGWLSILTQDTTSASRGYWCILKSAKLSCWSGISESALHDPDLIIPFNQSTIVDDMSPIASKITLRSIEECSETSPSGISCSYVMSYANEMIATKWKIALQKQLLDIYTWGLKFATYKTSRQTLSRITHSETSPGSGQTLYDEISTSDDSGACSAATSFSSKTSDKMSGSINSSISPDFMEQNVTLRKRSTDRQFSFTPSNCRRSIRSIFEPEFSRKSKSISDVLNWNSIDLTPNRIVDFPSDREVMTASKSYGDVKPRKFLNFSKKNVISNKKNDKYCAIYDAVG